MNKLLAYSVLHISLLLPTMHAELNTRSKASEQVTSYTHISGDYVAFIRIASFSYFETRDQDLIEGKLIEYDIIISQNANEVSITFITPKRKPIIDMTQELAAEEMKKNFKRSGITVVVNKTSRKVLRTYKNR
jgi:hypothetical protein